MAQNPKPYEFIKSSPSDIHLSTWQYHDFVDSVNDDRLSPRALMKFKELYRLNSIQLLVAPVLAFPLAYIPNKWITAFVNRGIASTRFNIAGMALLYPISLYMMVTAPIPRKLYTELIADNGDDGNYIRECLVTHKPGLWSKISLQFRNLNLDFDQNPQSSVSTQFPTSFIPPTLL